LNKIEVLIIYSWVSGAKVLAFQLNDSLKGYANCKISSLEEFENLYETVRLSNLVISVGGDGTILRVIRLTAPLNVPVVGINMGRIGYLTEQSTSSALERVKEYIDGQGIVEKRTMLEVAIASSVEEFSDQDWVYALNEAVIGRGQVARLTFVEAYIDGNLLANYAADSVIVATATGSTGYALSAGGPVLYPESKSLILKPVAPQLATDAAVVLHPGCQIDLKVRTDENAVVTLDGFNDINVPSGCFVRIRESSINALFLKSRSSHQFAPVLTDRLSSVKFISDSSV
jgi:NAD+ kinase